MELNNKNFTYNDNFPDIRSQNGENNYTEIRPRTLVKTNNVDEDYPDIKPSNIDNNYTDNRPKNRDMDNNKIDKNSTIVQWKNVLFEFFQNTSFHALRQITEVQPFLTRRIIWLLLFIAGTVIFLIQVGYSIQFYLSWPVAVDVKINYNTSIIFPALTICNENAFRATSADEHDQYYLLTELFTSYRDRDVDLTTYNATNVTLEDIYVNNRHRIEDLIVSCVWDGIPCSYKNFTLQLTDYGVCYTINGGFDGPILNATQTGTQGGLNLKLNIEQYEYMKGPNTGAGLKVLTHDPDVIPLVKDHGLAIPPGTHGFVAIKIVQVHNLKPRYGKCNDSVQLEYFDKYSISSCNINCKQVHLFKSCGCRDIYMPDPPHSDEKIPVCTLHQYQTCVRRAYHEFHVHAKEGCTCPVPCERLLFEPVVSYAATSNFDVDALLRSNYTKQLEDRFIGARETNQRVNLAIVAEDTTHITELHDALAVIENVFQDGLVSIASSRQSMLENMRKLYRRIHYHLDRGLEEVKYIIEHDFIRGWEIIKERTLDFVAVNMYEVTTSFEYLVDNINKTIPLNETRLRYSAWLPMEIMLYNRLKHCERARDNITEAHEAYLTGDPLLTFRATIDRRYDMSYISLPLLQEADKRDTYYNAIIKALDKMTDSINKFLEQGQTFVNTGEYDYAEFLDNMYNWHKGCKNYNYRSFQYYERIILNPQALIDAKINEFLLQNRTLSEASDAVLRRMDELEMLLTTSNISSWQKVNSTASLGSQYLQNSTHYKVNLARAFLSTAMAESMRKIEAFFQELVSASRSLRDEWTSLKVALQTVWTNMLGEHSTKAFYAMMAEDYDYYKSTPPEGMEYYMKICDYMLRTTLEQCESYTWDDFVFLMNTDFNTTDIGDKMTEWDTYFENIIDDTDIAKLLGSSDDILVETYLTLQQSLQAYLKSISMDVDFHKENFLELDVFMQELSYEEITQQVAYDLPKLLGDIGGSMGLFIGGSVLSIFEFLDVFVHNGVRIMLNK